MGHFYKIDQVPELSWCLPKIYGSEFIKRLRSGEINPEKLMNMTSKERSDYFTSFLGEHGSQVNRMFESKLLLKNQQRGIITWAQTVADLKPKAQQDLISKVNRMTELLNPKNEKEFLNEYANYKVGANITMDEAAKISELAQIATEKKQAMDNGGDRFDYGYAKVAFDNYANELKGRTAWQQFKADIKDPRKAIVEIAGVAKSAKSTLDNSALFRQGWKVALTHPTIWFKNSLKSFQDITRTLGNKPVMDEVKADIFSRPNMLNGKYIKDKLDIGVTEEQFPGSALLEKIPVLGRVHKAAENAFTAFQYRNRADLYDLYTNIAEKSGVKETTGIGLGKLVNSLTARGDLGRLEPAAEVLNNVFFSPRLLKSHIDVLTAHAFDPKVSGFVKKQAAINLLKIVSGTSAILATANAIMPGSVELDPRSSDFGQIKIGNTRFDVTGGMRSVVTLASRLLTLSSKSSTTGRVYPLNSNKYGSATGTDVIYNFFENKLSPAASIIKDLLKGKDFQGNKLTIGGEVLNLLEPLPITTFRELQNDPNSANLLLAMMADALGISTNTYGKKANTKELLNQFNQRKMK